MRQHVVIVERCGDCESANDDAEAEFDVFKFVWAAAKAAAKGDECPKMQK